MRDERGLDVNQVEAPLGQHRREFEHAIQPHHSVFGVEQHGARRQPDDTRLGFRSLAVGRRNQQHLVPEGRELTPEGLNRGGHPVDPRKVHVGDHQDAHLDRVARLCDRT